MLFNKTLEFIYGCYSIRKNCIINYQKRNTFLNREFRAAICADQVFFFTGKRKFAYRANKTCDIFYLLQIFIPVLILQVQ